jgi:hypothetical protein
MKKSDLQQLWSLPAEINSLQRQIENYKSEVISDVVTESRHVFPFDKHSVKIEGVNSVNKRARKMLIDKLNARKARYESLLVELENFVNSIDNPITRQIVEMKYGQRLTDMQIAKKLKYSKSAITKKRNLFLRTISDI